MQCDGECPSKVARPRVNISAEQRHPGQANLYNTMLNTPTCHTLWAHLVGGRFALKYHVFGPQGYNTISRETKLWGPQENSFMSRPYLQKLTVTSGQPKDAQNQHSAKLYMIG
ncbi:hypothetical protein J6590_024177 [Homalodisca vitripennis]|nr:hypothetical protein J6590_024177 [Homalodisca vitripennis]